MKKENKNKENYIISKIKKTKIYILGAILLSLLIAIIFFLIKSFSLDLILIFGLIIALVIGYDIFRMKGKHFEVLLLFFILTLIIGIYDYVRNGYFNYEFIVVIGFIIIFYLFIEVLQIFYKRIKHLKKVSKK